MNCYQCCSEYWKGWVCIFLGFLCLAAIPVFMDLKRHEFHALHGPMPLLRLESASIRHLNYSTSSRPFFDLTMDTQFSLENKNDVTFVYDNSRVSVLYGNFIIGDGVLGNGTLKGHGTKGINITFNMMSSNSDMFFIGGTHNLTNDIVSDSLNLTTYAQFNGFFRFKKYNLKFQYSRTSSHQQACSFRLKFTSRSVYDIQCP